MSALTNSVHLRRHYQSFLQASDDSGRILLTGHSHQAWPDVALEGLRESFVDAAAHVDEKWGRAFAKAEVIRAYVAELIGCKADEIALGANTHELAVRFLSALDLKKRPQIVTTTGEFHSLSRQLSRLSEEGIEVIYVDVHPAATLAERLASSVGNKTAAVMCSAVLFETATVVPGLETVAEKCFRLGAKLLVDIYHAFSVLPWSLSQFKTDEDVFVVGGGYKYAQWGEGVCFMRVPQASVEGRDALRPVYTGWFSDFSALESKQDQVTYGGRPCDVFAGSTYDPSSHYRAAKVIEFFQDQGLTIDRLRATSLHQTNFLADSLRDTPGLIRVTPVAPAMRGGFLAYQHSQASGLVRKLRERNIFCDARGDRLRLGPAPYLLDSELSAAADALKEVVHS